MGGGLYGRSPAWLTGSGAMLSIVTSEDTLRDVITKIICSDIIYFTDNLNERFRD